MSWYSDGETPSNWYLYLTGDADPPDYDEEVCEDEEWSDDDG